MYLKENKQYVNNVIKHNLYFINYIIKLTKNSHKEVVKINCKYIFNSMYTLPTGFVKPQSKQFLKLV